ncbi:CpsD/CapB family tyrosine-protein kinase [uncultured Albimonas sp.]|uniref:CpsD/CapB family tyrosine-protein kinase n=1 Tax=uncultured Albimonas sp. TaxID=1331701 RepID=UPI0030ED6B46
MDEAKLRRRLALPGGAPERGAARSPDRAPEVERRAAAVRQAAERLERMRPEVELPAPAFAGPVVSGLEILAWALRRHWRIPAVCMALAAAASLCALALLPPRHAAEAVIEVAPRPPAAWAPAAAAPAPLDAAGIETERRLLLSPEAVERVARRLDLAATPEFGGGHASAATAPAAELQPPPPVAGAWSDGSARNAAAAPPEGASEVRALLLANLAGAAPLDPVAEAARRLAPRLSARRLGDSRLIAIRVRGDDPALAARIATELVRDRLDVQAAANAREAREAAARLAARLAELEGPPLRPSPAEALARADGGGARAIPGVSAARAAPAARQGGQPPRGLAISLAARTESETAARFGAAADPEAPSPDGRAAERRTLLARLAAAQTAAALATPEARLAREASAGAADRPSPGLALSLALGGGLILGGALAWLRETGDGPPLSAAMASEDAGAPALAALPRIRGRADPVAMARRRPGSPLAESARRLRQSLAAGGEGGAASQVVAVLSPGPGEGKSTVAALLAESCARAGLRTALVDADVRAPSQARRYGLSGATDLVSVLAGEASVAEAMLRPVEGGPWLLSADPATARRAELLAGPAMARLIADLRRRFDVVILDTPPVLCAAEARALAGLADRRLLVMRWGETRRGDLRAAADALREARAPASGLALSAAPRRGGPDPAAARPRYGGFLEGFDA